MSPEEKEKERNVRKFGVSHNVAGHGKLRRALHRSNRGDKKIPGDKTQYVEKEGVGDNVMKIVNKYRKKQKSEKKPSMDSTTKKLHKWRKDVEHKEREKYVSPFRPIGDD